MVTHSYGYTLLLLLSIFTSTTRPPVILLTLSPFPRSLGSSLKASLTDTCVYMCIFWPSSFELSAERGERSRGTEKDPGERENPCTPTTGWGWSNSLTLNYDSVACWRRAGCSVRWAARRRRTEANSMRSITPPLAPQSSVTASPSAAVAQWVSEQADGGWKS